MSSSDESNDSTYPLEGIEYPGVHDVLCGRGGHSISHPGNVQFRMMVEKFKAKYLQASRYEKAQVTADVVRMWRQQAPPGRFLILTDPSLGDASRWHDIGDKGASKKVAQCLRERNPRSAGAEPSPIVSSTVADLSSATAAAATMPPFTPTTHSLEWKQRKQQQQQQRKQQHENSTKTAAHAAHHPQQHGSKHHQKPRPRQNKHQKHQNTLAKQQQRDVQKQVEQAEKEVWEAQQQVNQQAVQLQEALQFRAQHDAVAAAAAAVAAQQVAVNQQVTLNQQAAVMNQQVQQQQQQQQQVLNQQAEQQQQTMNQQNQQNVSHELLQSLVQAIMSGQGTASLPQCGGGPVVAQEVPGQPPPMVNNNNSTTQQQQQGSMNGQQQQQQPSAQVSQEAAQLLQTILQSIAGGQGNAALQLGQNHQTIAQEIINQLSMGNNGNNNSNNNAGNQQQGMYQEVQETQENNSEEGTMSLMESPLMWGDSSPRGSPRENVSRRESMGLAMPSAANLTKHVFDDGNTNGSSDSSTAFSMGMGVAKMSYSNMGSFSDTSSENSRDDDVGDEHDATGDAISDGSNSIARSSAYPPD